MHKYENLFVLDENFEWDKEKEKRNLEKHGIDFYMAVETFEDPNGFKLADPAHTTIFEERFYWVGKTKDGRILTTWFTKRGQKIRIIGSAEFRKFRRKYESTKVK